MPEVELQKYRYLSKSIKIYRVYSYGLLIAFFTVTILKPLIEEQYFMLDFLIGFPIFVMILLAPFGLYYSCKSYKEKEGNSSKRLRYFLGHVFFSLLAIFFIFLLFSDIKRVF